MPENPAPAGALAGKGSAAPPALEREILERVRARDREALGILYDRFFDRVYSIALRLTGDAAAAEDVAQDVFLRVHRWAHKLDPERDPAPWIAAITYNACRQRWRSRAYRQERRTGPIQEEAAASRLQAPGPDPEAQLLREERDARISRAVGELPEPLRTVVLLRDGEGLTHAEIAAAQGVREAAVRKRYSRALATLRETLKDLLE